MKHFFLPFKSFPFIYCDGLLFDCMEGMGLLPLATKMITFYLQIRQAFLQRAVLIQLMLGLGTPFFLAQRIKASFIVLSVLHAITETLVALQLWLLHLLSPSELKSIALAAVTYKNFGIMESSLTFHSLVIIFLFQANQDKLDKDL